MKTDRYSTRMKTLAAMFATALTLLGSDLMLNRRASVVAASPEQAVSQTHESTETISSSTLPTVIPHPQAIELAGPRRIVLGQEECRVFRVVLAEPGALTPEAGKAYLAMMGDMQPPITGYLLMHLTSSFFEALHADKPDDDAFTDYFMARVAMGANFLTDKLLRNRPCVDQVVTVRNPASYVEIASSLHKADVNEQKLKTLGVKISPQGDSAGFVYEINQIGFIK